MTRKEQLIQDIQNLLNSYDDVKSTTIDPELLIFMDEDTLLNIIDMLLQQKEKNEKTDSIWLEKFKKYK